MNKVRHALLAVFLCMCIMNAEVITLDEAKLQMLKGKNIVLQDPALSIKGVIEKPDSYILKVEAQLPQSSQYMTVFLDKKTSELYIGSGYDKEGNAILFPQDANIITQGIAFSYGKGEVELYIVMDPECSYCRRFEKAVVGKLDDFTVHVILFPLPIHERAPAMIEWIMQGKDDADKKARMEDIMLKDSMHYEVLIKENKSPFAYSEFVDAYIKKANLATMELNVRGTPSLFNAEFTPVLQEELLEEIK